MGILKAIFGGIFGFFGVWLGGLLKAVAAIFSSGDDEALTAVESAPPAPVTASAPVDTPAPVAIVEPPTPVAPPVEPTPVETEEVSPVAVAAVTEAEQTPEAASKSESEPVPAKPTGFAAGNMMPLARPNRRPGASLDMFRGMAKGVSPGR